MSSFATLKESLHPSRTALVVWDLQQALAGNAANHAALAENVPALIAGARAAGCHVVWSRHVGLPTNALSAAMRRIDMRRLGVNAPEAITQFMPAGSSEGEWVEWASPASDDVVLQKSFPTFFVGTALESLLRAWSVDTLVLAGVATDHGIDLTARHGLALGFTCVVASDATGSFTAEAHEDALGRLSQTAELLTVADLLATWGEGSH
jgi:nicotinamidase-related amidase